ncbi:MAG: hypothetical protein N3A60_12405, partial [Thermanaerothrix sp.]|nr:hypothetical protein [Thermanaerothrix sp.]
MSLNRASLWVCVLLGMIIAGLNACTPASLQPTLTPTPSSRAPGALIRFRGTFFSTAGECGYCHTALKSANQTTYSIQDDWRSTLMANAGRDPYYLAHVSEEINRHPQHRKVIEAKCATCHIGMASLTTTFENQEVAILGDQGLLSANNPLYPLALDGVSCSLCHQIQDQDLGTPQSFSGGFNVDSNAPSGKRVVYGRFDVNPTMATVMQSASGFIPQTSAHVTRSEFCAVCHNLFTPYLDDSGNLSTDLFAEQTPYTEWVHSAYR